uniref:Uncharacterized protein n=1 Tax=Romanomermis culicivorax TaxID=13658 RepID=A0A915HSH1_ROMCU
MVIKPNLLDTLKQKIFARFRGGSNDLETGCPAKVVETSTTAEKIDEVQKFVDDEKSQQQQQKEINDSNKQYDRQRTSTFRRSFSTFDHNQKRYRTIFDRVHCWSAAKWVVAVEFFVSSLFLIDYVINNEKKQNYFPKAFLLIGVCLNSLSILAIFLYVFGMYKCVFLLH